MEFLQTPDLARGHWSAATPTRALRTTLTPAVPGASPTPLHAAAVATSSAPPALTPATLAPAPDATPKGPLSVTPFISQLDRAGIKNSFQSLFSPQPDSVSATPALLSRKTVPGLTPFLNATTTPGLVPPSPSLLPSFSPPHAHNGVLPSPNAPDPTQRTPFLAAAAREAVRREFMNMPNYVAPGPSPHQAASSDNERRVPEKQLSPKYSMQVVANTGDQVQSTPPRKSAPEPSHTESTHPSAGPSASSSPIGAKVPAENNDSNTDANKLSANSSADQRAPTQKNDTHASQHPMHPFFIPHAQPPPGMMVLGQHAPMMMAPAPGMFHPPGMMVFPGAQPMMPQPGMMMHPAQPLVPPRVAPAKQETPTERKARVENEKQELIREFKKKTREAALVRFRQKRRERRFGKLIRYDCRKKLADARPRVKGRFVRLKAPDDDDESECAQVVPNLKTR